MLLINYNLWSMSYDSVKIVNFYSVFSSDLKVCFFVNYYRYL